MRIESSKVALLSLLALSITSSACVDEKIVFQDRELFEEVPTAAANYVGYTNHATKLTVCGNCHIEKQGEWEAHGHAEAWAGLQKSSSAQTFCEGCHTVSDLGNTSADTGGGYPGTQDQRYEDVQCESCHGPGLTHVTNPTDATIPLAPISVGTDLTTGCGECHSDTHHPFVEEWAASRHGDGANAPQYRSRAGCDGCHSGQGALAAWGVNTEYLEKGGDALGITCAVCHDPHGSENDAELRFPIGVQNIEQNLCMQCHKKRAIPDETSRRGPHSPQGPLLLGEIGEVGWTPPNMVYDIERIRGTHGTTRNERLCAGCHVAKATITDPSSGDFLFSATGHNFKAIPCVDGQGIPTGDDSCAMTAEARRFDGCTASGCHGDEDAALAAMIAAQGRIASLVTELNGLIAQIPADQFSTSDNVYTTGEGAKFNAGLGAIESSAIHNPFMTEALLTASIAQVKADYGLAALSSISLDNIIGTPGWNVR